MKRLLVSAMMVLAAARGDALAQTPGVGASNESTRSSATAGVSGDKDSQADAAQAVRSAGSTTTQHNQLEQHIAVGLLLGNEEEIALSQFGAQRAQNEQVKQFAQTMIEQHQQTQAKIRKAAPQAASMSLELRGAASNEGAAGAATSSVPRTDAAAGDPGQATTRPAGSTTASADAANALRRTAGARTVDPQATETTGAHGDMTQQMVAYMRDCKQHCLSLTTQELGRKQGADFDKAFMGSQISLHIGMLAHLQAAQDRVSDQMQPIIQEGTETTQRHLAQARSIMERLDASGGEGAARAAAGQSATQRQ